MTISTLTPLLSAKEVGLIIKRHEKTVLALAREKKIDCVRQETGSVLFTEEQVRDYIARHTIQAEPEAEPIPNRNPKYANR
jgi:hypothetical protein